MTYETLMPTDQLSTSRHLSCVKLEKPRHACSYRILYAYSTSPSLLNMTYAQEVLHLRFYIPICRKVPKISICRELLSINTPQLILTYNFNNIIA